MAADAEFGYRFFVDAKHERYREVDGQQDPGIFWKSPETSNVCVTSWMIWTVSLVEYWKAAASDEERSQYLG